MSSKTDIKDLGIEFMTNEQAFWNEIKENSIKDIEGLEKMLKFQKAIIAMCNEKIRIDELLHEKPKEE